MKVQVQSAILLSTCLIGGASGARTLQQQRQQRQRQRQRQQQRQQQQQQQQHTIHIQFQTATTDTKPEECCQSTYTIYKEFDGGVTFAQAQTAPDRDPELKGCVLAPIASREDLLEVSETVPPCKAAYTAVTKNAGQTYRESLACLSDGRVPYNCDYTSLKETLDGLWGPGEERPVGSRGYGACSLSEWFSDASELLRGVIEIEPWCPVLREGWTNGGVGSGSGSGDGSGDGSGGGSGDGSGDGSAVGIGKTFTATENNNSKNNNNNNNNINNRNNDNRVPSDIVWNAGDTVYCGEGPIPNAAAAFATDYFSGTTPTASLKAVNSGEALDGAVYRCCAERVPTCYRD